LNLYQSVDDSFQILLSSLILSNKSTICAVYKQERCNFGSEQKVLLKEIFTAEAQK